MQLRYMPWKIIEINRKVNADNFNPVFLIFLIILIEFEFELKTTNDK